MSIDRRRFLQCSAAATGFSAAALGAGNTERIVKPRAVRYSGAAPRGPDITDADLDHLRRSIELSDLAASRDYGANPPFGAVLALADGRVTEGWNHVYSDNDPTLHGELWLIRHTIDTLALDWRARDQAAIEGATLYSSTEPCAMCAAAMFWTGIRRIVYGCSSECLAEIFAKLFSGGEAGGGSILRARNVFGPQDERGTLLLGPALQTEARAVHERRWPELLGVESPFD